MTTRRSGQPPAPPAERAEGRGETAVRGRSICSTEAPAWRELPEETCGALTGLMVRLILEHAQANGAVWRTEAGDDL